MTVADHDAEAEAAARLRESARSRVPCRPVRELLPPDDVTVAYRVQQLNVDAAVDAGSRVVGHKIGLTNPAVQQQLGVDQPDFGTLFDDMWYPEGLAIPLDAVMQPRIEAELAVVLAHDLLLERPTVVDVVRAVDFAVPALEIVGSRIASWDIGIVDTVADNASSGAFVLGGPFHPIAGLDASAVEVALHRDDEVVSTGSGRSCLGNPLNAAAWLAGQLARSGTPLRSGEIILTGALCPMVDVDAPGGFEADFGAFGKVAAVFAEDRRGCP